MTYAPSSITALARYWTSQGGRNLGIVGDTRHQAKGRSYHLGASQLTPDAYSRKTARDRAGLSEAASRPIVAVAGTRERSGTSCTANDDAARALLRPARMRAIPALRPGWHRPQPRRSHRGGRHDGWRRELAMNIGMRSV